MYLSHPVIHRYHIHSLLLVFVLLLVLLLALRQAEVLLSCDDLIFSLIIPLHSTNLLLPSICARRASMSSGSAMVSEQ